MLDGLTLDQMRVFEAVVEHGGFRAAASRQNRAPSVIGHAITGLRQAALFGQIATITGHGRAPATHAETLRPFLPD